MENPQKQRNVNDLFIIATPTNSGKADIDTIRKLDQLPFLLQKGFMPVTCKKKGVARARTMCLVALKDHMKANNIAHDGHAKIFWLDDDCVLDESFDIRRLAEWIRIADRNGWNLVANYKEPWHNYDVNVILHRDTKDSSGSRTYRVYEDGELNGLKELEEMPDAVAGMGFCYIDTPLDYIFREEGNSEDICFEEDNKVVFHWMPVKIFHEKKVYI
jgi:hypothetical protein